LRLFPFGGYGLALAALALSNAPQLLTFKKVGSVDTISSNEIVSVENAR